MASAIGFLVGIIGAMFGSLSNSSKYRAADDDEIRAAMEAASIGLGP